MAQAVDLDFQFELLKISPSDTNEHMQTLKDLASECALCTEFGVRYVVTTWALIAARPQQVTSYDIEVNDAMLYNIEVAKLTAQANGVTFNFYQQDVLATDFVIAQTDLLLVDLWAEYDTYKQVLNKHASKVNKYIAIHGINIPRDEDGNPTYQGPKRAAQEFLAANGNWTTYLENSNVHGLLVLKKT